MRIIAGVLGGRTVTQPKTHTVRPMSEKVRGALFDILGSLDGVLVLDAYAGSGAVGFEAASRGAAQVIAIEKNAKVSAVIKQTMAELQLENYALLTDTVESIVSSDHKFDVIVADPPYAEINWDVLEGLGKLLTSEGILIVSHASRTKAAELKSVKLGDTRLYGDTALSFYRRGSEK